MGTNIFGFGKPDENFQNEATIDKYQNTAGVNYSATGTPAVNANDVLNRMWMVKMRELANARGVDGRPLNMAAERQRFFSDRNNIEQSRSQASWEAQQAIANARANELDQARQNASFDTGIASRGMLYDAAMGAAPSQAQMLMQRRGGEIARNAMSMARSAREYNPALMAQAMNQGALAGVELGSQAGEMRAREMADARNALLNADQSSLSARAQQANIQQGAMGMLRDEYLKRDQMQQDKDARVFGADYDRDRYNVNVQNAANNAGHGGLWRATDSISNLASNAGSLMSGGLGGGKK